MWEQIQSNKRRSAVLVAFMLLLLLALGFSIGSAFGSMAAMEQAGEPLLDHRLYFNPLGGLAGMGVALIIWSGMTAVAFFAGDRVLLAASGARQIHHEDHPQLVNIVEEMVIASNLGRVPRIYIIDDPAPNAFAAGRKPENASVAVTSGLLAKLNRDQLQGVVAHEIAHIVNRDVMLMTLAGVMLGSIVMISDMFLRSLRRSVYHGSSRRLGSSRSKGGGGGHIIMFAVAIVLALLAPLLARVIYFAISRRREYLADASAAVYTRYPEGLAGALEVIAADTHQLRAATRATAPMYIINPIHKMGASAFNLTRTHPPIQERIAILRSMAGGVSYRAYQRAMEKTNAGVLPPSVLKEDRTAEVREAAPDSRTPRQQMREASDLVRDVNRFLFLACTCGMRIKLPPAFKHDHVDCPRCKNRVEVPFAQLATMTAAGVMAGQMARQTQTTEPGHGAAVPEGHRVVLEKRGGSVKPPLAIAKADGQWITFACECGAYKTLAPGFLGDQTRCDKCGRTILVHRA